MRFQVSRFALAASAAATLAFTQVEFADAAAFGTSNRVVVLRVGDGATALAGTAAAAYLEEYSINFSGGVMTGATHVQTIPVATTGATGTRLTMGGTAAAEGGLNFSANGQYLMFAGYDANLAANASGGNARRIVGRVDLNGVISYDAVYITGSTSTNNGIRTVASNTGNEYWIGQSATPGITYRTWSGGDVSTNVGTSLNTLNTRRLEIFNSQLYVDSAASGIFGIATVGTGLPTATGQTVTILPGMPTATGPSPYDYWFADANTVYVADDRTTTSGGLQKWTFNGSTWSLAYTYNVTVGSNNNGLRGLTGAVDVNGNVSLFATTTYGTTATANQLVGISDTLSSTDTSGLSILSLASSASIPGAGGALTTFRGLEDIGIAIPEPTALVVMAAGGAFGLVARRRRA